MGKVTLRLDALKANEEYISENYQHAVELYTKALAEDCNNDDVLVNRAQAYLKLNRFQEAVADCDKAVQLNCKNVKAYLRKGCAFFHLGDYKKALNTFKEGSEIEGENSGFTDWIEKCEVKLKAMESEMASAKTNGTGSTVEGAVPVTSHSSSSSRRRYDWYQTQTHVIVTVLQKNVKKEDLIITVEETSLSLKIRCEDGEINLDFHLAHPIIPDQTVTKSWHLRFAFFKKKIFQIEIKLKKAEGLQWTNLEDAEAVKRYPSSSHFTRNWDKIEKEVKEEEKTEKLEGDAALNKLFQQIYADGSDEVKKAMMKSFTESGGTVLSTNWSEVGKEKVEVKPPDGMEFKKYEM
ncbi:hypothetical protein C0Q70_06290 [Pomacea canaliculata]|uniref:Uncharacterized protein n=1 Tax=Pomacea canaliculata TaxID=400727 RepID=A0A2T7PNL6_POMCA|nr:hypothetical protein C0Q70_06290 [Pomacea canaliculata]